MKLIKEWLLEAPWGNIALVSWGNEKGQPVLLVHGRQDSAATFLPLLEFLPQSHHYVALDLPGHGNSTPFPVGAALTRTHFVAALKEVVDHVQWRNFVYIAHSMGAEMGMLYNVVFPGRISKFILIDPILAFETLQLRNWFETFYSNYYDNYDEYNNNSRVYKKEEALNAVQKARGLTKCQAKIVLSRNLIPVGNDIYRLSWDKRLRYPALMNVKNDYCYELFTVNPLPTLVISARDSVDGYKAVREDVINLFQKLQKSIEIYRIVEVKGDHDVHLKNPERIAKFVVDFLLKEETKSRL